jgi:lipopolysaccharide transport protein LptA
MNDINKSTLRKFSCRFALFPLLLACLIRAGAADEPETQKSGTGAEITADTVDMDFANKVAHFKGNVRVTDQKMQMSADEMRVFMTADNQLKLLKASGHVVIDQPDMKRRATAGKAEYNVETQVIILTEQPVLTMGENTLSNSTRITYNRNTQQIKSEGGKGQSRPSIRFKPENKKDRISDIFN